MTKCVIVTFFSQYFNFHLIIKNFDGKITLQVQERSVYVWVQHHMSHTLDHKFLFSLPVIHSSFALQVKSLLTLL